MNPTRLKSLLIQVQKGRMSVDQALERLKHLPFEDIDFARVDHHRSLRKGFPEVIFGQGKTARQIAEIMARLRKIGENILVTRLEADKAAWVIKRFPKAEYHPLSRVLTYLSQPITPPPHRGLVLVISAGTSDLPVAGASAGGGPAHRPNDGQSSGIPVRCGGGRPSSSDGRPG